MNVVLATLVIASTLLILPACDSGKRSESQESVPDSNRDNRTARTGGGASKETLIFSWRLPTLYGEPDIRTLSAYDLESRSVVELGTYGAQSPESSPGPAVLASDGIIYYLTSSRVTRFDWRQQKDAELFRRPSGNLKLQDIDISPDQSLLAVTLSANPIRGSLFFLDSKTGQQKQVVHADELPLDPQAGYFWQVNWRDDGQGVVVQLGTSSERPGGMVTIFTDGRARIEPIEGFTFPAPSARAVAHGGDSLGCMLISGHRLAILDLDTDAEVVVASDDNKAFSGWAWSPDGREFLYQVRDFKPDSGCDWALGPPAWSVVKDGSSLPAPDVDAVYRRWYGNRLAELACRNRTWTIFQGRSLKSYGGCSDGTGELRVGGNRVGDYFDVQILGFLPD